MMFFLARFAGIAPALTIVDTTLRGGAWFLVPVLHASLVAGRVEADDLLLGFGIAYAGFLSAGHHAPPCPICPHQLQPAHQGTRSFTAFAIMLAALLRATR